MAMLVITRGYMAFYMEVYHDIPWYTIRISSYLPGWRAPTHLWLVFLDTFRLEAIGIPWGSILMESIDSLIFFGLLKVILWFDILWFVLWYTYIIIYLSYIIFLDRNYDDSAVDFGVPYFQTLCGAMWATFKTADIVVYLPSCLFSVDVPSFFLIGLCQTPGLVLWDCRAISVVFQLAAGHPIHQAWESRVHKPWSP
jgi:hypothetical protein